MTAAAANQKYTIQEYLSLEARTGQRHEFFNGNIVPMPGGTLSHNRICKNVIQHLGNALDRKRGFELFGSDQKIYLPDYHYYVYPDAVVVAATPVLTEDEANAIINPLLVVVVLSPSTGRYDREYKFVEYRSLPSFREYVLIRQDAPEILTFFREQPDTWKEAKTAGLDQQAHFRSVDVDLALELIYRNIEFGS